MGTMETNNTLYKMGALVMFGLVSAIAIVGVIYFNRQDKKQAKK